MKVDLRVDRIYEFYDSFRFRKGDFKVGRLYDNDDDVNYEIDVWYERVGRIIISFGMDLSYLKS